MEEKLTERELEIVKLVADGLNSRQIADQLFISYHTVKTHIETVYNKLQINNRIRLALWFQGRK